MKTNNEIIQEIEKLIARSQEASNAGNDMAKLMAMGSVAMLEVLLEWINETGEG